MFDSLVPGLSASSIVFFPVFESRLARLLLWLSDVVRFLLSVLLLMLSPESPLSLLFFLEALSSLLPALFERTEPPLLEDCFFLDFFLSI